MLQRCGSARLQPEAAPLLRVPAHRRERAVHGDGVMHLPAGITEDPALPGNELLTKLFIHRRSFKVCSLNAVPESRVGVYCGGASAVSWKQNLISTHFSWLLRAFLRCFSYLL